MKPIKRLYKGLEILSKYSDTVWLDHRVVHAGSKNKKDVPAEDQNKLEELGWLFEDGWSLML